jgi:spore coat protein H
MSENAMRAAGLSRGGVRPAKTACSIAMSCLLAVWAAPGQESGPQKSSELFRTTNVWTVHLTLTPEQWDAMEPKGARGGFFGDPGGPRGRGGPRGPGGMGPAVFIAPTFLKQGDQNHDGKLSREEFHALAEKWFVDWDQPKGGKLTADQVGAGLNSTVAPPDFGAPGAGGRGPGLNLQGQEGKRNGLASAMGIEFPYVHADMDFEGRLFKNVAVRYKGNGTWMQSRGSLKRSLKVDLTEFGQSQKLAGVTKVNFHNNVTDSSWMNEVMSHRLFREAGVPAARTAFARIYVTVAGKYDRQYLGLYSVVENIDNNFAQERFGTRKGALLKPVTRDLFNYIGDDWAKYKQTYDPKTGLSQKEIRRVIDFAKLLANAADAELAAQLGNYLDLDEFARFMAVTVWLSTMDSILGPGQNYYVYLHPETHKFEFMPWDLDHSFGQFGMMGSQEQREQLSIHQPWQGQNRFLERVFKVAAFKQLYLAKLDEFSQTIFRPERFPRQVDEIAAAIRPAIKDESETKLARFDQAVSGEPVEPMRLGEPPGGPQPGSSEDGPGPRFGGPGGPFRPAKPIKTFVTARAQSVVDQLAGKSEGQTMSGFGFGGRGGGRGPGGPGRFGPGMFLGNAFMAALDTNQDQQITRDEFTRGFARWFDAWDTDKSGLLTEEQLRAGINQDFSPARGNLGGPGFGPPTGPPPREP